MALAIHRSGDEEAHVRERELVTLLTSWVQETVSARRIRDIHETMRFAVWITVRHPDRTLLVAELDGQPAGILLGEIKEGPKGRCGFVEWIAVEPDRRRQGIGSTLVDEFATSIGVDRLEGSVNLDDPVAVAFWERQGWTRLRPPPRRVMMGGPNIRQQA